MTTVTVTEARASLPEILERIATGESVTLTRHGVPIAVIMRPDMVPARRTTPLTEAADALAERLAAGPTKPFKRIPFGEGRADELVAEIRRGRDAR